MNILVHKFNMGDVEDPELYAAFPIHEFETSEKGKWLKEHSTEQMWYDIGMCRETYGYKCTIFADLADQDVTFFNLKWGS